MSNKLGQKWRRHWAREARKHRHKSHQMLGYHAQAQQPWMLCNGWSAYELRAQSPFHQRKKFRRAWVASAEARFTQVDYAPQSSRVARRIGW